MRIPRSSPKVFLFFLALCLVACGTQRQQTTTTTSVTTNPAAATAAPAAVTETGAPTAVQTAAQNPNAAPTEANGAGWDANAVQYRGRNGERFPYNCGPNGAPGSVWGTGTYTDDSNICTAAVHAGLASLANGGNVTIEIRPGESAYKGTTSNGITSSDYGSWVGSYVFVVQKPGE